MDLTDVAASKVKNLLEQEGRDDLRLRIAVQPGGCSGLVYQLYFDERMLDGDLVRDFEGVEVIVDRMSAPYLQGAVMGMSQREVTAKFDRIVANAARRVAEFSA